MMDSRSEGKEERNVSAVAQLQIKTCSNIHNSVAGLALVVHSFGWCWNQGYTACPREKDGSGGDGSHAGCAVNRTQCRGTRDGARTLKSHWRYQFCRSCCFSRCFICSPAPVSVPPPLSRLLLFQVDDNELPVTGVYTLQIRPGHFTVVCHTWG